MADTRSWDDLGPPPVEVVDSETVVDLAPVIESVIPPWWKAYAANPRERIKVSHDMLPTIAMALSQIGMVSAAFLMNELMDPQLDRKAKRQIALAMAPKLVQEFRGKIPGGGHQGGENAGGDPSGTGGALVGLYGLEGGTTKLKVG